MFSSFHKSINFFFWKSIHAALIQVYCFIHSISKYAVSTQPLAGDRGSCKNPYDFIFPLKLLTIDKENNRLLLARDKYGWLLRSVSVPLSLAEQKAVSAQQKMSWYQLLNFRGLLLIRPLPWPESFHCCTTTEMCPDCWPYTHTVFSARAVAVHGAHRHSCLA